MRQAKFLFLDIAHAASINAHFYGRAWKPGEYLRRLPQEVREEPKNLRSDDVKDVRVEPWWE